MEPQTYEIQDLVERSGVARRTIYFYVQQGLLPPPSGAGLAARYAEEHLLRLRLIPQLRRDGLRLDQIRDRLAGMSVEEMRVLLEHALKAAPPPLAVREPLPYLPTAAQACLRYDLPGGVILIVPTGLSAKQRGLVEQILASAAQISD